MKFIPFTEFVADMFEKRDLFNFERKYLFQTLAKKIGLSVYGGNNRNDINEEFKCVRETWMKEKFKNRVKEGFLLKNGNLKVK